VANREAGGVKCDQGVANVQTPRYRQAVQCVPSLR